MINHGLSFPRSTAIILLHAASPSGLVSSSYSHPVGKDRLEKIVSDLPKLTNSIRVAGMPRHPRVYAPGLLYHVMARGNNGQPIFLQAADYESFLKILHVVRERYPFYLYAYVLMPNHFHLLLLLEVAQVPTARLTQSLLTTYVREFNGRHRRRGHLFHGRYKAIACDQESYLLELVRYIHLNPVRARLVRRPSEWRWSGHGEYLRTEEARVD